ncbi:MAG: radical SAM protein [Acidobacteria bacterium]|nr:radical SAM protein [Acidobacteriota bacterium]
MRVVLISTYELGRQPFGVASAAAWLRARGHEVETIDTAVSLAPPQVLRAAEVVAFSLPMHTATRLAAGWIRKVREENADARLIAFGLYAPLNAEYLRGLGVERVIGGEFEEALAEAVEGRGPAELVSLGRLPFLRPDRSTLAALGKYAPLVVDGERRAAGSTEASRGCKHLCRHCPVVPVYGGTFRIVPREVVLADIEQQVALGARHITFGDPDFLNGPGHAMAIAEAFHERWPAATYDVTIKIEHLLKHRDLLGRLAETGCLLVTSAVECVEDEVLRKLEKGHTRACFLEALALTRAAGLHLNPTFVPFTPWTTVSGYRELLKTILEQELVDAVAPVQLALRLLIPAGSLLLELPEIDGLLDGFDAAGLLHRWRHPEPAVDALASQVFAIVGGREARGKSRRALFAEIWEAAHGAAPPENYSLLPRAAVPYLDEPWYC